MFVERNKEILRFRARIIEDCGLVEGRRTSAVSDVARVESNVLSMVLFLRRSGSVDSRADRRLCSDGDCGTSGEIPHAARFGRIISARRPWRPSQASTVLARRASWRTAMLRSAEGMVV